MKAGSDATKVVSLRVSAAHLHKIDALMEQSGLYNTRNDLLISILRAGYKRILTSITASIRRGDYSLIASRVVWLRHTAAAFDNGSGSKDSQFLIRFPSGFYTALKELTDLLGCSLLEFVRSELYFYINRDGPREGRDSCSRILDLIDREKLNAAVVNMEMNILQAELNSHLNDLE